MQPPSTRVKWDCGALRCEMSSTERAGKIEGFMTSRRCRRSPGCRSSRVRLAVLALLHLFITACGPTSTAQAADECRVDGALARLAALPEASGVAVSRR